MIHKDHVMQMILEACPSFIPRWKKYCASNAQDEGLYSDFAELAHHLIDLQKGESHEELGGTFQVIETLHRDGDPFVSEAASIGLLEDLLRLAPKAGLDPQSFTPYLGEESSDYWQLLGEFSEDSED